MTIAREPGDTNRVFSTAVGYGLCPYTEPVDWQKISSHGRYKLTQHGQIEEQTTQISPNHALALHTTFSNEEVEQLFSLSFCNEKRN